MWFLTNLTGAIISFYFELLNAAGFTRLIISTIINTSCKTLTINIETIVPVFVLRNILNIAVYWWTEYKSQLTKKIIFQSLPNIHKWDSRIWGIHQGTQSHKDILKDFLPSKIDLIYRKLYFQRKWLPFSDNWKHSWNQSNRTWWCML